MARAIFESDDIKVEVATLNDGLVALQVFSETDTNGKRKCQEIVVDTKWDTILTGGMPNMLLHVLAGRKESFKDE